MPWLIARAALMIGVQMLVDGRRAFRIIGLGVMAVALLVVLATITR